MSTLGYPISPLDAILCNSQLGSITVFTACARMSLSSISCDSSLFAVGAVALIHQDHRFAHHETVGWSWMENLKNEDLCHHQSSVSYKDMISYPTYVNSHVLPSGECSVPYSLHLRMNSFIYLFVYPCYTYRTYQPGMTRRPQRHFSWLRQDWSRKIPEPKG